jgi:alkylation response protein AidB-like acyl-CoA dehydrogenase
MHPLLERGRALVGLARESAPESERLRNLPPSLVEELTKAGIFRLALPRTLGGEELDLPTFLEIVGDLARGDGSVGWCAMIAGISGVFAAALPLDGAREVFSHPDVRAGGVLAPLGSARPVEGGYLVSGRWPFASGCQHCDWLSGGALVTERSHEDSAAQQWLMPLFPAQDVSVLDTWDVSGLRGTGSHDIEVRGLFVPERHTFRLGGTVRETGPLYRVPLFGVLAAGVAAVALGVARAALDEIKRLALAKVPLGMTRALANRPTVQIQIAEAEGKTRAARALLRETVESTWQLASKCERISSADRAALRLACTHATLRAAEAVSLAYSSGGGTSLYAVSPLQRHLRDIHAITQHFSTSPATLEVIGRVLLGAPAETTFL